MINMYFLITNKRFYRINLLNEEILLSCDIIIERDDRSRVKGHILKDVGHQDNVILTLIGMIWGNNFTYFVIVMTD